MKNGIPFNEEEMLSDALINLKNLVRLYAFALSKAENKRISEKLEKCFKSAVSDRFEIYSLMLKEEYLLKTRAENFDSEKNRAHLLEIAKKTDKIN